MIKVNVNNKTIELNEFTSYYEVAKLVETDKSKRPFLIKSAGIVKELRRMAKDGENIEFLYYDSKVVKDAYYRTATLILLKAIKDVYGNVDAGLKFRVQNSFYFEIEGIDVDDNCISQITEAFEKNVKAEIVIKKIACTKTEAFKIFNENKLEDMNLLFTYSYRPKINLRYIDNYVRYVNGDLLYHTGYVKYYKIKKHKKGLALVLSDTDDVTTIEERLIGEKEFGTLNESTRWAKKLEINTVGKLNRHIANDSFDDLVIMTESFQDKQIGDIAEKIKETGKRLVFIAGPSSSGKTSFSHRLSYHLTALDLKPHSIACDNFFKERKDTPKDENGEYDFETIKTVDIDLLNRVMKSLLNGEKVEMPTFNFVKGVKEYKGNTLQLNKNDIIVFEGIHCLNPELVPNISQDEIFKIYVSALTEVCIDNANRIATSDLRLIRRLVRDINLRGISAKETLLRWPSVRRGEEKSIFPYQEKADIFFNSALIYEFSVLKDKALAKLFDLSEDIEVGEVARRLIKILNFFLGIDTAAIPRHSIIREFIGDSIMRVG